MEKRVDKLFEALNFGLAVDAGEYTYKLFRRGQLICKDSCDILALDTAIYVKTFTEYICGCDKYIIAGEQIEWLDTILESMTEEQYTTMWANLALNRVGKRSKRRSV